jgi:hypothetical protein
MQDSIRGTFHFHSTYSHDGKSTLPEIANALRSLGLSFCVMTEHFEDLDADRFDRYIAELAELSSDGAFNFIPGVEVHLSGIDTIFFPAASYREIVDFETGRRPLAAAMCKVIAHPSKYDFDDVARHLDRYPIDGIEVWNQQADGSHIPPLDLLQSLKTVVGEGQYRYFFGCDLHSAKLKVTNTLAVPADTPRTAEGISRALLAGTFAARNSETAIEYRNGPGGSEFGSWVSTVARRSYFRGKVLRRVRRFLRSIYRGLPRNTQKSLNDFKNLVRNKV